VAPAAAVKIDNLLSMSRPQAPNSQLTAMGLGHLHVRSVAVLEIKVHASLLALACLNLD